MSNKEPLDGYDQKGQLRWIERRPLWGTVVFIGKRKGELCWIERRRLRRWDSGLFWERCQKSWKNGHTIRKVNNKQWGAVFFMGKRKNKICWIERGRLKDSDLFWERYHKSWKIVMIWIVKYIILWWINQIHVLLFEGGGQKIIIYAYRKIT